MREIDAQNKRKKQDMLAKDMNTSQWFLSTQKAHKFQVIDNK